MTLFSVYGVQVNLDDCDAVFSPIIIEWLREDFAAFSACPSYATHSVISIQIVKPGSSYPQCLASHRVGPLMRTKMARVYGFKRRVCIFPENHKLHLKRRGTRWDLLLMGSNKELTYEILYIAILSLIGEALERQGFVRLHGCSFNIGEKNISIAAPSGWGKSELCLRLLETAVGVKIFSDEILLFNPERELCPFPIRIATKVKGTAGADLISSRTGHDRIFQRRFFEHKQLNKVPEEAVAKPQKINKILWAGHCGIFGFFVFNLLGLGLPQMREYRLRSDNICEIFKSGYNRACFLGRLVVYKGVKIADRNQFGRFKELEAISRI